MGSDDRDRESDSNVDVESEGGHEKAADASGDDGETEVSGFALGCMPIARLGLRSAEFLFTLICFSLLAAAQGPTNNTALKVGGFAFLMAFSVITCVYAIATIVLLVLALLQPDSDLSYKLPRPLLIADFVLLVTLFAASSSCATAASVCTYNVDEWGYVRNSSWCGLVQGAAAMGFLASFTLMADFWLTLVPVFAEI